eukprot:1192153-Alexandrium_andersonii.AAC.1
MQTPRHQDTDTQLHRNTDPNTQVVNNYLQPSGLNSRGAPWRSLPATSAISGERWIGRGPARRLELGT